MNDREKKIAEIREALEKATPGQWKWIDPGGLERKKLVGEWEIMNFGIGEVYDQVAGSEPDEDDAHLIVNAPEWLRFLLDELERKEEQLFYKSQEITELREVLLQDQQWFKQASANITEMQKELDRIEREYAEERAAHNAHVTELCELEKENRKLRQERDAYYNNARYTEAAFHEVTSLRSQLQSAQQEIERLREENEGRKKIIEAYMRIEHDLAEDAERYLQQRDKLIECLLFYERMARGREANDGGRRARTLLAEIGVTVE